MIQHNNVSDITSANIRFGWLQNANTGLFVVLNLVKDDDPHDLALHDDDPALVVDADAARVLEDVGAEFADELAVLVVDLDLRNAENRV